MAGKKENAGLYILVSDLERFAPSPVGPYLQGRVVQDCLGRGWLLDSDAREVLERAKPGSTEILGRCALFEHRNVRKAPPHLG